MGKVTEIKFVGQPIFKQVIGLIDAISIQGLIRKHDADRYYKAFKAKTHLITVLFGILSRCDSMTEICEGLRALGGKLNHLGLEKRLLPKVQPAMGCVIVITGSLRMYILVWCAIRKVFCRTAEPLGLLSKRYC